MPYVKDDECVEVIDAIESWKWEILVRGRFCPLGFSIVCSFIVVCFAVGEMLVCISKSVCLEIGIAKEDEEKMRKDISIPY